jgi:hypothetical protein
MKGRPPSARRAGCSEHGNNFWAQMVHRCPSHNAGDIAFLFPLLFVYRLCGLVVRVPGYRFRSPGLDSRRYQIFWEVLGQQRGKLSLISITEKLLELKSSGYGSRKPTLTAVGIRCYEWDSNPSIWGGEDCSCFGPRGPFERQLTHMVNVGDFQNKQKLLLSINRQCN